MSSDQIEGVGTAKNAGSRWYLLFLSVVCLGLAAEVILLVQRNRKLIDDLDRGVSELLRVRMEGGSSSSAGVEFWRYPAGHP